MPLNPIQKSKLANKSTPNVRVNKQSWLHSKLHFLLPERNRERSSKPQRNPTETWRHEATGPHSKRKKHSRAEYSYRPQAEHFEAWRYDVTDPDSESIAESRKTCSQTKGSQTSGPSEKEPDWFTHIGSGGYFESPQAGLTRSSEPPPIKLPQELRQSYSEIQDFRDPSTPPPALMFSKEQADYYDNLFPETRKTYVYPLPAKAPEFEIPKKPLLEHRCNFDENIKVKIGKNPNSVRPQTTNIPLQANPPKPHSRAKSSSSQNSSRSEPSRTPSRKNMEELKREFSDFEYLRPSKELQKLQQNLKETKHAQPQTVTSSELQRYKSIAGVIHDKPSRGSSMQFSEPSHSRPGSSRIHAPVEQFQAQGLSLEMLEDQYYSLEAQDRQNKEYHQSSAKSFRPEARFHKPSAVTTHQSPGEIPQIEARPLPPTPKPHRSSEVPIHSSTRSQRPRIPSTPTPIENIRQLETEYSPRIRTTSSSHRPAETPIYSSARSYRPRAPKIPRSLENNIRLETGFLERFPISHQPLSSSSSSSRPHRPPAPLAPKPPQRTVHFEERPWRPPPNTLKKRRRPPLESPQPLSDKVKPRPPVPSSGKERKKKRRWWKI
ncbi:hypothetical protein BTUL_0123g00150 [Botrytis tulipae]|uniref:Uncharacterized protein n=1 Tax=Botrytis tulipae TaxID=87230 RepID=A0A4Z1EKG3_9HELO|nr:hypothetical protein BTUL_0123g00150 [Botrytis tulipae]